MTDTQTPTRRCEYRSLGIDCVHDADVEVTFDWWEQSADRDGHSMTSGSDVEHLCDVHADKLLDAEGASTRFEGTTITGWISLAEIDAEMEAEADALFVNGRWIG